ncbi:MAG: primosomal protein N', partial [Candidatus Binatia bacterium]
MPHYAFVTPLPAVPTLDSLSYLVPDGFRACLQVGARVIVPLGRRKVTGLVTGFSEDPPPGLKCRPIESMLDAESVVPEELIELSRWMAEYYLADLGEVLSLAIGKGLTSSSRKRVSLLDPSQAKSPAERAIVGLLAEAGGSLELDRLTQRLDRASAERSVRALERRQAVDVEQVRPEPRVRELYHAVVELVATADQIPTEQLFARAPKRRELFEYLSSLPGRRTTLAQLAELFCSPREKLRPLEAAGLVRVSRQEAYRSLAYAAEGTTNLELTAEQRAAVRAVEGKLGSYECFLLHGVTASGKTEVYLQLLSLVLERGQGGIVLVPEISLTHQLVSRLAARFGPAVAVLHSGLGAGERWDEWRRICRGEARVVLGARSAVLAPVRDLGLIVVDEEHDGSYKQEDGVRYNGRDVAVLRANRAHCPVLLGSATPSTESWHHAREGRYTLLSLSRRVLERPMPIVEVVDLRGHDLRASGGLTARLAELMTENFAAGGQTLLFLNRRGFANHLQCLTCGGILECRRCSVGMTLHLRQRELRCHHCDARRPLPRRCPACNGDALSHQGLGTEKVEAAVRRLLPQAAVERLDRDTNVRKGVGKSLLSRWRRGDFDVLIGTQMISKGHDAPGVTLVGIIQADLSLSIPDFRAAERTFQLLSQVTGRAGRGERKGRALLQTYCPDHPAITSAARHGYLSFVVEELEAREELGYPPFSRMALLRFESVSGSRAQDLARRAATMAEGAAGSLEGLTVRGPAPAPIERLNNRYRYVLQLRCGHPGPPRRVASWIRRS